MAQVESILEQVEATFFMTPVKDMMADALVHGWEQQLKDIHDKLINSSVKLLCSQMEPVETVLDDVERTFFMAPGKALLTDPVARRWEQQLKEIVRQQKSSHVSGAHGRGLDRVERKVSDLCRAARSPEEMDLVRFRNGWRPTPLEEDYVAGVDNPDRAEYEIVTMLQQYANGRSGDRDAKAPRVGICAIGGSGKSTACAGVTASERVRDLFPRRTVWVQLNASSSMQTVADAAVALAIRCCGDATAKNLLRQQKRDDFVEVAARLLRDVDRAVATELLVVIDDVLDSQQDLLRWLLRVVPLAAPLLFTTRAEAVVDAVAGAKLVTIDSLPDADARVLIAAAIGKRSVIGPPDFSDTEELELVRPVLEKTECHALSLSIVAALIAHRSRKWQQVVVALKSQWMDVSFARPRCQLDPRPSVRATLDASLTLLPDDASRAAFEAIGVLPANELVGMAVLQRLWRTLTLLCTGGGSSEGVGSTPSKTVAACDGSVHPTVELLVEALARAGLLHQEVANGNLTGVVLHPVICGYARSLLGDEYRATHRRLLGDYAGGSPTDGVDTHGWRTYEFWGTPDDGYWYNNVARHAAACRNICALVSFTSNEWRSARVRTGSPLAYQADLERVIVALRAVVSGDWRDANVTSVLLGILHRGLALAYLNRVGGSRADNTEEAIALLQQALELVPRGKAAQHWATIQNNLGNAYTDRVGGDRAANVEAAVACYHLALEVRTREAAPLDWAKTQNNLGLAYTDRVGGDHAANVEAGMACYRPSLELHTRDAAPLAWATTQINLGLAYTHRVGGDRGANVEAAVACYRLALEVHTREAAPLAWATTQINLGLAYTDRVGGDRGANVEAAVACCRLALEVHTRQAAPLDWAATQHNLGNAYTHRVGGDRGANVEAAVACYRLALEVHSREAAPLAWAATQNNLGNAYTHRVGGDRGANVEASVACYRLSLEVRTREAAPLDWAMTKNNLGIAYTDRVGGDRGANVEAAVACYRLALEVHTREAAPLAWATTQNNLGNAYTDRVGGDRGANVEAAVACYRLALEVRTREAAPLDWAATQNNLGNAYTHRVGGDRGANVEAAVACYRLALEVRTRQAAPLDWATTQNNLGGAYTHRVGGDRAANVEAAVACYRLALEVRTREAAPLDWAATQHNLGNAYTHRVGGDRGANVEAAVACYRLALEVRTREAAPQGWASTTWNMFMALQESERWVDALAAARTVQAFGSEWASWNEKQAYLASCIASLEGKVGVSS
ncbi:hypothetical protein BU14_0287s0003 [Porphyra umbilicalis]|uniref:NB-ARC domain-containing protein n=1 Tax=Porphyra umbilicalis TaxID=2786 RepID=A0A1X6P0U9_PORUM|nr:hypothetical protein BU14_0287s0003 [Porphyra umbilicalis]|eukprot:OSX74484.1 hypothetical protein BU14_0287s0003 [Porphyra umbilicalis]